MAGRTVLGIRSLSPTNNLVRASVFFPALGPLRRDRRLPRTQHVPASASPNHKPPRLRNHRLARSMSTALLVLRVQPVSAAETVARDLPGEHVALTRNQKAR